MTRWPRVVAVGAVLVATTRVTPTGQAPTPGLTAAPEVARAYDLVLDAAFERLPAQLASTCGPAPRVACLGLEALSLWWQIALDPDSRALDDAFLQKANLAIAETERWSATEPARAEAWFYVGAAYGVRAEWRVLRAQRLAAARDGKRIKDALDRTLAIDPTLHDAEFGLGMYRYYADIAPAVLKLLRWLLLLPGGNRVEGLAQLERASQQGVLVRGEAAYQIHLIYLWYEHRVPEALQIIRGLQARYPHNPLFHQIEAEILDVYLHDHAGSLAASEHLLSLARGRQVHRADIAEVRARLNMAVQLRAMQQPDKARDELDAVIALAPNAPAGALATAERMRRQIASR